MEARTKADQLADEMTRFEQEILGASAAAPKGPPPPRPPFPPPSGHIPPGHGINGPPPPPHLSGPRPLMPPRPLIPGPPPGAPPTSAAVRLPGGAAQLKPLFPPSGTTPQAHRPPPGGVPPQHALPPGGVPPQHALPPGGAAPPLRPLLPPGPPPGMPPQHALPPRLPPGNVPPQQAPPPGGMAPPPRLLPSGVPPQRTPSSFPPQLPRPLMGHSYPPQPSTAMNAVPPPGQPQFHPTFRPPHLFNLPPQGPSSFNPQPHPSISPMVPRTVHHHQPPAQMPMAMPVHLKHPTPSIPTPMLSTSTDTSKRTTTGASESGAVAIDIPLSKKRPKKMKMKRDRKKLRLGGGTAWEDPTLDDWDSDDFRIFCGDLGNDVNDDTLSRPFSRYPSFLKAKVIRDKYTKKTKGYGFVSFKDPHDFMQAMRDVNGRYIGNRPVKLRKSTWKDRCFEVVKKKEKEKKKLGFR